jgi:hypothetical protein
MKTIATLIATIALTHQFGLGCGRPSPVELKPIFTGTNLAGWRVPDPNPFWRVEDGVLIGENDEQAQRPYSPHGAGLYELRGRTRSALVRRD